MSDHELDEWLESDDASDSDSQSDTGDAPTSEYLIPVMDGKIARSVDLMKHLPKPVIGYGANSDPATIQVMQAVVEQYKASKRALKEVVFLDPSCPLIPWCEFLLHALPIRIDTSFKSERLLLGTRTPVTAQ